MKVTREQASAFSGLVDDVVNAAANLIAEAQAGLDELDRVVAKGAVALAKLGDVVDGLVDAEPNEPVDEEPTLDDKKQFLANRWGLSVDHINNQWDDSVVELLYNTFNKPMNAQGFSVSDEWNFPAN